MMFANGRDESEKIIKPSLSLPMINSATSIFAGCSIFAFMGHIAHVLDKPIDEIVEGGIDLAFIVYPGMLTLMPWGNFFSVLFFLMLITVGIDSIFAGYDYVM